MEDREIVQEQEERIVKSARKAKVIIHKVVFMYFMEALPTFQ